ncbi:MULTISPECIES: hypothetical protein [unclassified Amycolatopsis]|uniref:hypothetical protein n=1 Tax=unclassified Amycolatopsis TaxID=2618356 RepID=UPI001EE91652|nr:MULTISPECIES: hypothetical protein [unclassified Amycolatopsis]MCG3749728.1 hypothetical protein [Amycolatopsis sp. Poz14]
MIRIQVTNNDDKPRTWNVEPYGDEVVLSVDDVLSIEYAHPADVGFVVTLYPDSEVVWTTADGGRDGQLPNDLKLNGVTLWPGFGGTGSPA